MSSHTHTHVQKWRNVDMNMPREVRQARTESHRGLAAVRLCWTERLARMTSHWKTNLHQAPPGRSQLLTGTTGILNPAYWHYLSSQRQSVRQTDNTLKLWVTSMSPAPHPCRTMLSRMTHVWTVCTAQVSTTASVYLSVFHSIWLFF